MIDQQEIKFSTNGRGTYDISSQISASIKKSGIKSGICTIFIKHTSASLALCENIDPAVREDLDAFMAKLVPSKSEVYKHKSESSDYMPAHIKTVLTHSSLTIPIEAGKEALGMWQGIFLWEHREDQQKRFVSLTIMGD